MDPGDLDQPIIGFDYAFSFSILKVQKELKAGVGVGGCGSIYERAAAASTIHLVGVRNDVPASFPGI